MIILSVEIINEIQGENNTSLYSWLAYKLF
jgi:hypothetical protein